MNIDRLLERRNAIYGACAIWIILFHVFRSISMPYIPVLTNIIGLGNMAVDVFVFFSGLCLTLAAQKHGYTGKGWKAYFSRRLVRVLLPYLIIAVPYYLWNCFAEHSGSFMRRMVVFGGNLSSASFWLKGTQTTWFAFAILVFYLLFPLLFTAVKKNPRLGPALLAGAALLAVASAYTPIVKNSLLVWARLPVFVTGILVGFWKKKLEQAKTTPGILLPAAVLLLAALGWWISLSELGQTKLPQVCRLLLYLPMTLALLYLISLIPGKSKGNGILHFIGTLSFEIYLIHITLLHPLRVYGLIGKLGYWLYPALPAAAILVSWLVSLIEKQLLRRFDRLSGPQTGAST